MFNTFGQRVLRTDSWNQPRFAINDEWSSSWSANNALPMPLNERHLWITTRDWTNLTVYKDWNAGVSYNWAWKYPSWSTNQFYIWINNSYDYYDWYAWYVAVQKNCFSPSEAVSYYKKTKKYFGVS